MFILVEEPAPCSIDKPSVKLPVVRWGGLATLLVGELLLLTIAFDSESVVAREGWWARLLESAHILPQLAVVFVTATIVFGGDALRTGFQRLGELAIVSRGWWVWCLVHCLTFAILVPLSAILFEVTLSSYFWQQLVAIAWLILGLATAVTWCFAVSPPQAWLEIFKLHRFPIASAAALGVMGWTVGQLSDQLWLPLGQSTMWLVFSVLRLFTNEAFMRAGEFVIGASEFEVLVKPECSGYEGMGLAAVFVGTYLWWCRHDFRWPQAWLLLPLAIALMWLCNGVRIAALILIGSNGWKDIAMGGFHSQAGWMAFNVVVLGLVFLSRRSRFFSRVASDSTPTQEANPTAAYLLPFIALLGSIMVTTAFSSGFDWLYPVRVFIVAGTILAFAGYYARWDWSWSWHAMSVGAVVFGLWMALEHWSGIDPKASDLGEDLARLPPAWAACWLLFRVIGSVLLAPFAEELAFRGYLMRRVLHVEFETVPATRFSWFALLVSSALFGALHPGRWLAGTVAGLLYGLVVYRRGNLVDAVWAHATTNALIALYVLSTGTWTLWS